MKTLVTGATGFIGIELLKRFSREANEIRILTRNVDRATESLGRHLSSMEVTRVRTFEWDSNRSVAPATALEGVDTVFHLAGENIGGGRWTEERKRRIRESREIGTRNLVAGLNRMASPPVFISASAIGFYGDAGDRKLDESSPKGEGFLADVCEVWETEARKARTSRLVLPRFGIVLGRGGGALEKLLPLFRTGLGGKNGNGKQWMSWIHVDDLVAFLVRAATDPKVEGVHNLVSSNPVRNSDFAKALGDAVHRPALLPTPAFALRVALGQMAEETILASQRVAPQKLTAEFFSYAYPDLEGALRQIAAP
ncbi:MAG: TIGR01777 family oxidoreductase [Bdellovibrionales bacterium]|nr:TIGR01777 family oxidoreductase [Bdellovibrionales bacterium]